MPDIIWIPSCLHNALGFLCVNVRVIVLFLDILISYGNSIAGITSPLIRNKPAESRTLLQRVGASREHKILCCFSLLYGGNKVPVIRFAM